MNIMRNIQEFVVSYDASIHELLSKVNSSKNKTSYVVDEQSVLLGSFSDGDFRRWILNTDSVDLSTKLCDVMNKSCFSMSIDDDHVSIKESFSRRILSIPLLDSKKKISCCCRTKATAFFY